LESSGYTGAAGMFLHWNRKFTIWQNWNNLCCRKGSFSTCP